MYYNVAKMPAAEHSALDALLFAMHWIVLLLLATSVAKSRTISVNH